MNNSAVFPKCVYTILHTKRLDDLYQQGGAIKLTEKKKWATAASLFQFAKRNNQSFYVIYAPAEATWELIYFAKIKNIEITADGKTKYEIENLTPTTQPRPIKTNLILASTGQPINEQFIRPYAICKTPEFIEAYTINDFQRVTQADPE